MYRGGCLCGRVRYEIRGGLRNLVLCHCSQCRKAQGSAFAANAIVDQDGFHLVSGAEVLKGYESAPGKVRYFCATCGSPIMSRNQATPRQVRIRLGSLDSDIRERPEARIFVTSKANWDDISDDLPQYEGEEPGR